MNADPAIGRAEVMPLLLGACPSFASEWIELEADSIHINDDGTRLGYLDIARFGDHLVGLVERGQMTELPAVFDVVERLHVNGDGYVRELATIGLLEQILLPLPEGNDATSSPFYQYLGPETERWWNGLARFWSGNAATVMPVDSRS